MGSEMARPVYLQQRTYLMNVATAVECHEPTFALRLKLTGLRKKKGERTSHALLCHSCRNDHWRVLVGNSLLSFAVLDHLIDLLLHRIEIEGSRFLHRRIVDRRLR